MALLFFWVWLILHINSELKKSEELLSKFYNCSYFSYPFGGEFEVNNEVIDVVSKSSFRFAFMNNWSWNYNPSNYKIQRISLPNTKDKYLINAHLSGFYYFLKYLPIKDYKISFVIATHNLSLTKKFDSIIKLSNGKIL